MRVKGAPLCEGVDLRKYFHIHAPFANLPNAAPPGGFLLLARRALKVLRITRPRQVKSEYPSAGFHPLPTPPPEE